MTIPKKWIPILSFLTAFLIIQITRRLSQNLHITITTKGPRPVVPIPPAPPIQPRLITPQEPLLPIASTKFATSVLRPIGEPYTKMLIVPRTRTEDITWVLENFGPETHVSTSIYVVDDLSAALHGPKNKGHEVMVYLSYIIEHYEDLKDVNIFMHSHRVSWHNDELLEHDAVQMVNRLSAERVMREGYMNMRCGWEPGCPAWMHPGTIEEDVNKQEQSMLAKCWTELFPLDPIPDVLAQPCCAQFAISRDRIRSLPLSRYVFYRDWLLRTSLSDFISGRVWEYVWQFVFTGQNVICPKEHVCYCDGFGVCFGGEEEYDAFYKKKRELDAAGQALLRWRETDERIEKLREEGKVEELKTIEEPEVGMNLELEGKIRGLQVWVDKRKQMAKEHGDVAMNRAKEAGREWQDGDGF